MGFPFIDLKLVGMKNWGIEFWDDIGIMILAFQLLDVQQLLIIIKKNILKVNSLFSISIMKNLKNLKNQESPITQLSYSHLKGKKKGNKLTQMNLNKQY